MLIALLEFVVRRMRGNSVFSIGAGIGSTDLLVEVVGRFKSLVRAQWKFAFIPGGRIRFCESSVFIEHRRHLYLGRGSVIEHGARLRCLSSDGFKFGSGVTIGKYSILECTGSLGVLGKGIRIGNGSSVGDFGFIGSAGGVQIGSNVLMGQRVSFHAQNHNFEQIEVLIANQGTTQEGIEIGDNCWIGSGAIFLDGVTIGSGSIVSAGSVVTKSFPENSVVAGVPARLVRTRAIADKKG